MTKRGQLEVETIREQDRKTRKGREKVREILNIDE
jgi:hypothetical protein